ncbi:hypothetical protein FGG08_006319 [Glutinoglossum americanum]|uniref:Cyclin N-terminal domain-containing protein n=1 Tax=Glutinoglossum americanum TaxID=1670608 RepID=A0A9P8L111_9PEZI|nr:hypothetical protein FGG08_006319 [Glutinoglossum americanum]
MDAKPQRPLRSLRVHGDENIPVEINKGLHQRHKSMGTLSTMMSNPVNVGGLKAAAKRTAFGDVSNTKNLPPSNDSAIVGKKLSSMTTEVSQEGKPVPLLRPAQRPLSVSGLRAILNATSTTNASYAPTAPKQPLPDSQAAVPRKALTKRPTIIFKDNAIAERERPAVSAQEASSWPTTAPVRQNLAPRHHKSQPYIRAEQPAIRRTKSKHMDKFIEEDEQEDAGVPTFSDDVRGIHSDSIYQDGGDDAHGSPSDAEEPADENDDSGVKLSLAIDKGQPTEQPTVHTEASIEASFAEPEEYWEDEDEDDYCDEEGYTTARSRGENTTGGPTAILFPQVTARVRKELAAAKQIVESTRTPEDIDEEFWDTSMVAEYGDEIFQYMRELEIKMLPNAHYMDNQAEIQWSMRSVLMDWLIQVHHRFSLLPETLFLCVNYIDRFLSCKIVSLGKLQLVGATAIFVAAKYEEINCPSVQEIVYMVDSGYSMDEILKAERFMLSMLQFELGWPGPMSFLRRISKADDYDLETRTLAKYFLEITIMDERFVGSPPSYIAAGAHCLARHMLRKGDWSPAHVYYSDYTYSQLHPLVSMMLECCESPRKHHQAVFEKYCDKRYKRAALFVEGEMGKGFSLPHISPTHEASQTSRRKSRK